MFLKVQNNSSNNHKVAQPACTEYALQLEMHCHSVKHKQTIELGNPQPLFLQFEFGKAKGYCLVHRRHMWFQRWSFKCDEYGWSVWCLSKPCGMKILWAFVCGCVCPFNLTGHDWCDQPRSTDVDKPFFISWTNK